MSRRNIIIGAIALVVVVAGVVGLVVVPRLGGPPELNLRQEEVVRGAIQVTVSAAGNMEPAKASAIGYPPTVNGIVSEVLVEVGDRVEKGQRLAGLETRLLEIAQEQSQLLYDIQDLTNQKLEEPPSENDLKAAQAQVWAAGAQYNSLVNTDPEDLEIARLQVEQGTYFFNSSEIYNKGAGGAVARGEFVPEVGNQFDADAGVAWVQAELKYQEYLQLLEGPPAADVNAAGAAIALANAELALLEEGPQELTLEMAALQLEQANLAVERTTLDLQDAVLRAPFDGIVSAVFLRSGTPAPSGLPAIELIDNNSFHIDVDVDEIDIGRVAAEQPVMVVLDALPDQVLTGEVAGIAPDSSNIGGVVSYLVRVNLDPTDVPLRAGMTATVDIVVEQQRNVLRVPNWAIRIERRTGDTFVNILGPDGELEEIEIDLGLRGGLYSQVLNGLEAGDEVAISLDREEISFFGGEE